MEQRQHWCLYEQTMGRQSSSLIEILFRSLSNLWYKRTNNEYNSLMRAKARRCPLITGNDKHNKPGSRRADAPT